MATAIRTSIPDHLMQRVRRATAAALPSHGSPTPQAHLLAGGIARELFTDMGMIPETDKSAEELSVALQWRSTAAIRWLFRVSVGESLSAAEWDELAKYPNLLRECAAWFDALLAQYHEGDQTR